ncbi:MAG TPA: helix-turn-helix domain-containing protein [Streptosporangiaceae bacterium]|nr:helix-turn-helix domain-containing protein [Streptosporangiaceae bacterium]
MFEVHLQHIAERLARDLHRSVIIDDAALRPLAISPQTGRLDPSRVEAVLQRQTSAGLRRRMTEHGVFSARGPVSIPGDPQQAILPRLCLPLLADDQLLGFLWLIDEPALTKEQTRQAQTAAAQATHLLSQREIQAEGQFAVLSDLADGLLQTHERVREEAAAMLAGQAALTGPPPYALAVIRPAAERPAPAAERPAPSPGPSRAAGNLRRAAGNLRRRAAPGTLVLASPGEGELVAITTTGALAEVRRAVRALPGPPLALGTCGGTAALADVHASLGNAQYAAHVAARVPRFRRAADWASLGVYAAFQHLYCDPSAPERICPGVSVLLDERAKTYRQTVRCYLECAAQAQQAAAQLHIHRTTLYWRLARAAEMVPLDLRRGEDRLKLHVALALADLTHPPGSG